jgi:hypothetical protein
MTNKDNKIQHNKKRLLKALEKTLGNVSNACKIVDLDRTTFYRYYNEDEEFADEVDNLKDMALDYVESKLFENIKQKKETSIIFYLKTQGRKRGYNERLEIEAETKHKGGVNITFGDIEGKNSK